MIEEMKKKLRALKLPGMLRVYETFLTAASDKILTNDDFFAQLVDAEYEERYTRRVTRYIKRAHLRCSAAMERIDFPSGRNLNKTQIKRLSECQWIEKTENIIINGATGAGKSYLASAFGHAACTREKKVLYFTMAKLFCFLREAKADNTYARTVKNIASHHVLIVDDFGLEPFTPETRRSFLEILDDRYGLGSTIIATQLPVEVWLEVIGEPTIAEAIVDRLVHNAHRIQIDGPSYRAKGGIR